MLYSFFKYNQDSTVYLMLYFFFLFYRVLEGSHLSFVESVPFKIIATFTLLQFAYFLLCFGVTWIPVAGILFPLPFFLLISIREHVLPKFFQHSHLQELDASEYEEIAGAGHRAINLTAPVSFTFFTIVDVKLA